MTVLKKVKVKTSICIARLMHQAPLTRIYVTETAPPGRYLGHRPLQPANKALGSDPTTSRRQRQPASRSRPS